MDWLQFTSAIVGHLAWPVVVGVLLFTLRKQLTGLAIRLKELSLPGGMKATFEKELEVGRTIAEQIPDQPQLEAPTAVNEEENKLVKVAIEAPEGAVVLAYIELEKTLRDISLKLGMRSNITAHHLVLKELVRRRLITSDAAKLYDSLRRARNSAAHGMDEEALTTAEAVEYIGQVNLMVKLLRMAESNL
jgi:hypothetical protein